MLAGVPFVCLFVLVAWPAWVHAQDSVSDQVGATAGQFRVDESGAATYSVPIQAVPGTAGVAPDISLNYSSQGGDGPLGRGWAVGGLSAISRCRSTREAGDFIASGIPQDGTPPAVNYGASDRYCLDGQRLLPAPGGSPACPAVSGYFVENLRTQSESFQRVCAYSAAGSGANDPRFFSVERPDGSTSFYGDRDDWTTAATRPDGYVNSTAPGHTAKALSWWQTRFQDSTGNYIDFRYLSNPAGGAYPGESLISSVEYTGKKQLAAQTGGAWGPYAKIVFNYAALSTTQYVRGSVAGGTVWQTRQLSSITVIGDIASGQQARHYALAYSTSVSGSGARTLTSIRECRDSTQAVCLPQTSFAWAPILNGFYSTDMISNTAGFDGLASLRLGDVDGDGLTDVAWFSASGNSSQLQVSFGEINGSGQLSFNRVAQLPWIVARKPADIDKYWHLFDYDGDGRDDLFVAIPNGNWVLYPSSGRPTSAGVRAFNAGSNLIAALSPPISSTTTSTILADLNGDGLLDVMYRQPASGSTPSLLYTRLTERMGAGFEWGAQRSVGMATDLDPPQVLLNEFTNLLDPDQRVHLFDFNGDSRSDLAISTGITWYKNDNSSECSNPIPRPAQPIAEWTDEAGQSWREWPAQVPQDAVDLASNRCTVLTRFVELYGVTSIQPTHVQMSVIKRWHRGGELWSGFPQPPPPTGSTFKFADFNGDGLTDALVKSGSWSVDLTGIGVVQTGLPAFPNEDYLQLTDVNGDGRADIVYPQSANSNYRPFVGHFARPDGTFPTYASPLPGGYARGCKNTTCDLTRTHFLFGDFDGDAATDFFALYDNTSEYYSSRPPSNHRFVPRDVIGKITDGVGAVTELSYRPLTLADVYRRGTGTRAVSWGRGSPVQDVFGPQYVVIRAQSSAPVYGNPNALSAIYYRYSGARIQAGGGGHLGFEQVQSFDTTPGNAHIVSTTTYRQDAPFIGMPQTTERRVVNGAYVPPSCLTGWVTNACFQRLAPPFPWIAGTRVALSTNSWESSPGYWSGSQTPVHVRMAGSQEDVYALESGALTSQVLSAFSYQGYGFAGTTSVDTYGAGGSLVARVQTNNVYDHYTTPWRLGRLRYSTVTHTRNGVSTSRRTDYTYDIGAAFTGLLTSEQVQSNGGVSQNLRTFHTLDAFGNRTHTYTCSSHLTEAACKSTAVTFQPTSLEYIHRYARTQYDSRGRYPVASYSPFWNGSGTSEYLDSQVLNRNLFGDVTHARDANAINTTAIYGQLGRLYQRATDTGVPVQTTWRTCSQVACPPGAVTRQQTTASGAPTQWSYHDVLGRVVLAVSQTRHLGTVNKGFSGVCTAYDAAGRPSRVSEPFFLASAASAVEPPSFASNTCTARYWNLTHYDALGRVTQVVRADGTGTSVSRSGLTTTTWDPNGNATSQTVNALGEVVTSTDAAGLSLTFTYAPDGQIAKVSRNAGRGDVETTFQYDPLGRKTSQTDRDTGTTSFAYNALGELIRQTDSMNNKVERWLDARGRLWRQQAYAGASLESTSQFVFDTLKRGLPSSESISGSAGSQSRSYGYDGLARPIRRDSTMDARTYREETRYDGYGRAWKTRDASGGWLKQQFDARGFATRLCDSTEADTAP
ncbi:FG-GAP-like repeat-containing protein, partial [Denitratimonas tolerans]